MPCENNLTLNRQRSDLTGSRVKIALVHDWLTGMRGGEKCLEILCEIFPQADIFTLIHKKGSVSQLIESRTITTSFLQKFPGIFNNYRNYIPLFPIAIESFNLSQYNLIISTSHCVAKGIKKPKDSYHACYCFTPMRYGWTFFEEYFGSKNILEKTIVKLLLSDLKRWDLNSNKNVDKFIAISNTIKKRIKKFYNRESEIVYPPVNTNFYNFESSIKKDFFLIVSALVPYKRIDIAVDAFNQLTRKLMIIGSGPQEKELQNRANLEYIEFLGWQSNEKIRDLYQQAQALIFPGEEDFGIVPLEAQSCGTPVIAYEKGGTLETIIPNVSGMFFKEQNKNSLIEAVVRFDAKKNTFDRTKIRENALKFSKDKFKENIKKTIIENYENYFNPIRR